MTSRIRYIVWGGVAFALFVGLIVWSYRSLPFDSSVWEQERSHRPQMVEDLLANYKLKEMSRKQIEQMLGKPTGQDSVRDNRYIYWAGYAGIDDMWLGIQFEEDQVVEVYYRSD